MGTGLMVANGCGNRLIPITACLKVPFLFDQNHLSVKNTILGF